jgi:hypothetical protein
MLRTPTAPFVWAARVDKTLEKVEGCGRQLDQIEPRMRSPQAPTTNTFPKWIFICGILLWSLKIHQQITGATK